MLLKSAVFWGVTRRRVVIVYRRLHNYHTTPLNTPEDRTFHEIGLYLKAAKAKKNSGIFGLHKWCSNKDYSV
jgi:hypothetical protein